MKIIRILMLLIVVFSLLQCAPKEKPDTILESTDSVVVEENITDTTSIEVKSEIEAVSTTVREEVKKEVEVKPLPNTSENTKTTVKQEVKTVIEQKAAEVVKKEVPAEKIIEKSEEVKKEAVVVKEEVKTTVNTASTAITEKASGIKNPVPASAENLKEGKYLYDLNCKACHGSKGLGDGTKAKSMKGDLGDFSSAKFQAQSDGELFNKTKNKIGDHPGFSKKLSDEDIWLVILYVRSLKK